MTCFLRLVFLLPALHGLPALAQTDTVLTLQEVTIRDNFFSKTGFAVWMADSLPASAPLSAAERLSWENPLAVRATGPGTLATVSVRGAGPAHTPVFWEGINLQSPMHGVVDAALLPVWPGDILEVQFGGQSALQSSGALGGAIHLKAAAPSGRPGWTGSLGATMGSFGRLEGQGRAEWNWQGGASSVRAAWQSAENDFPFRNTALIGAPLVRQRNNFGEKLDIQQFNRWAANDKNTVETAVWFQKAHREIPPAMTAALSDAWQGDEALRAIVTWKNASGKRHSWLSRLAWLDEQIDYRLYGKVEKSRSRTIAATTEFFVALRSDLSLKTVLNGWRQEARADGYSDSTQWFHQHRLSGAALLEYRLKSLQFSAALRQEWAGNQAAPFTGSLGGQWQFRRRFTLRMHLSRNFNLPTFNDRFWRSLGNPDLEPEHGYSADAGLVWKQGNWSAELTTFQILMDNWILWQPGADGLFRPGNLRQVWSRGAETSLSCSFSALGSRWKIRALQQWTKTTNTAVYSANTGALDKQLPYTPLQSGSASIHWNSGRWSAAYLHQWTGSRYRTTDNSVSLPPFHTGNFLLTHTIKWSDYRLDLHLRLDNCWNTAYQILEYQPMPGRSWRAGVQWIF